MPEPICLTTDKGNKVRILTPQEYDVLITHIKQDHLRTLFNVCFFTGMRYMEVQRLYENPSWVMRERGVIYLGREASKKVKMRLKQRHVPIPPQLVGELPYFFKNKKPPTIQVWSRDLKRWARSAGIDDIGVTPKMTRASIESWMLISGIPDFAVCNRQGHDKLTQLNHYMGLPFTRAEVIEIKSRLAGWNWQDWVDETATKSIWVAERKSDE